MNLEIQLHCLRGLCSAGKTVYLGMWPKPAAGHRWKSQPAIPRLLPLLPSFGVFQLSGWKGEGHSGHAKCGFSRHGPWLSSSSSRVVFAGMSLIFWGAGTGSAPLESLLLVGGSASCTLQDPNCASPQHLLCRVTLFNAQR